MTPTVASVMVAAATNTARHPKCSAIMLDSGLANRIPSSSPPMMVPTTRPRDGPGARCAASGIRICTVTELRPTSRDINRNAPGCDAMLAPTRLAVAASALTISNRRFSNRSANGTRKKRPNAYPIWVSDTMRLAPCADRPTSGAISSMIG